MVTLPISTSHTTTSQTYSANYFNLQKFVFRCLHSSFKLSEYMDARKGKGEVGAMKAYGVVEVHFLSFLPSGLGRVSGQIHASVALTQRNSSW